MLEILFRPSEIDYVACSGGPDSMCLLSFLRNAGHRPQVLFFNHLTPISHLGENLLHRICYEWGLDLHIGYLKGKREGESPEEWWRKKRYEFFDEFNGLIATAHSLDDAVESYLFYCLRGDPKTIPARRDNYVRPLLTTPREMIRSWNHRHEVAYIEDPSNLDLRYSRNRIRHRVLPEATMVAPGLRKTVRRMILERLDG